MSFTCTRDTSRLLSGSVVKFVFDLPLRVIIGLDEKNKRKKFRKKKKNHGVGAFEGLSCEYLIVIGRWIAYKKSLSSPPKWRLSCGGGVASGERERIKVAISIFAHVLLIWNSLLTRASLFLSNFHFQLRGGGGEA